MKNGLVKIAKNVSDFTKHVGRNATAYTALALAGVGGAYAKNAGATTVYDFDFFAQSGSATQTKEVYNNGNFTVNGGLPNDSNYKAGFFIGEDCVGYANNTSRDGEGFLEGYYCNMSEGQKPTGMYVIHDANNDGIGDFNTATRILTLGADDTMYTAGEVAISSLNKIEIGGIEGNVSALPIYPSSEEGAVYLDSVNLIPEPVALTALGASALALLGRRKKD